MESDLSGATFHGIDWDEAYLDRVNFRAAEGSASKCISTIIQPRISIGATTNGWIDGREAIEWLQLHMNSESPSD